MRTRGRQGDVPGSSPAGVQRLQGVADRRGQADQRKGESATAGHDAATLGHSGSGARGSPVRWLATTTRFCGILIVSPTFNISLGLGIFKDTESEILLVSPLAKKLMNECFLKNNCCSFLT